MNRKEIGEFLYRFYRKRTFSFLANIYKASITGESRDIHRARLDVKKIFALYGLFEMVAPEIFRHQGGYKLFRPLFRQAGKIREIQVNYLLLTYPQPMDNQYNSFIQWLREEEQEAVKKFIQLIKKFREKELTDTDKVIQKICRSSSIFKLRSKTKTYIRCKAVCIRDLQASEPGDKELHRIRQNLKAMSAITTLVYSIKPVKQLDMIITALNKTEMMIGDWHDRVVLKDAVERFLNKNAVESEDERNALNKLKQALDDHKQNLVQQFIPGINELVLSVTAGNQLNFHGRQ
jgi:CHAD domain-containing protein